MEPKTLYGKYLLEREGTNIVEKEYGFATYKIEDDYMYIVDVFVDLPYRKSNKTYEMFEELKNIAKNNNISKLLGSVCTNANGATNSIKFLIAYDFKLLHTDNNMIYFKKEI